MDACLNGLAFGTAVVGVFTLSPLLIVCAFVLMVAALLW